MIGTWPCTLPCGAISQELVVQHANSADRKVLIIPPLFSEHNLMRRFLVETMRRLGDAGIGSVLPDLPGWNESLQPIEVQTLAFWRRAMQEAAQIHGASEVLAVRSGALLVPEALRGWSYAPQSGAKLLRALIRARTIASREAGVPESSEELLETGRREGLTLAGWQLGAEMFRELETAEPTASDGLIEIAPSDLGGPGLWLRAEPDENSEHSSTLAALVAGDRA